jgi:aminoglycoside phosphotransferase (APT) family kinase protein
MNTELWHPDITITDELACKLIEHQFKTLVPVKLKCIGEGWDNKVFLVNEQFVFRFPHRKIAASLIERENTVLKHLQEIVELQIPNPVYLGKPSDNYPFHYHGYPIIKGKSGCHAALSESARAKSINKLAELLRCLHNISQPQARKIGADRQLFDRTNIDKVTSELATRVEKINARHIATINLSVFNDEILTAKKVILPEQKVLIHGDLYCRHLMFHHEELVGIIDWGDTGINSPAVDLSVIFSFYPQSCHQAFFDIYGTIDENTFAYARFLGLYSALTVMLYGHDVGDKLLVSEANDAILRINPQLLESKK